MVVPKKLADEHFNIFFIINILYIEVMIIASIINIVIVVIIIIMTIIINMFISFLLEANAFSFYNIQ